MSAQDTDSDAGPAKRHAPARLIRRGPLLTFLALALAVVVTATVARWPAHAADPSPEDAAGWNPGQVTYQYDLSGCHTIQQASIGAATTDIATIASEALDKNKIKDDFGEGGGVKVLEINDIRKNGTHIDLTIDGWLSNDACARTGSAQQASFPADSGAAAPRGTQALGTADPTRPDRILLVAATPWEKLKEAVKVVVAAAAMVVVTGITAAVLYYTVVAGGSVITALAAGAVAGCVSRATVELLLAGLFTPGAVESAKDRIAVATQGCVRGAGLGSLMANAGRNVAANMRRHLSSDEAIVGQSAMAAAKEAGVTMDNSLASMVDGVADGALRAAQ
jgi:hypothetical protein